MPLQRLCPGYSFYTDLTAKKGGWSGILSATQYQKIMQPFFTTRPTGEGTGLGLSLTYDMVKKGHGGTIKVDSKEGKVRSL